MSRSALRSVVIGALTFVTIQLASAQLREGKFGIGFSFGGNMMISDLPKNELNIGGGLDYVYLLSDHWGIRGSVALDGLKGKSAAGEKILNPVLSANFAASYDFSPEERFNPFAYLGFGVLYLNPVRDSQVAMIGPGEQPIDVALVGAVGFDYFVDPIWSISFQVRGAQPTKDKLDGAKAGSSYDSYASFQVGVRYYFYDFFLIKKILAPEKSGN